MTTFDKKFLGFIYLFIYLFFGILDDETATKTCHAQVTCGDCIAAGPKCGWCTQEVLFSCINIACFHTIQFIANC